MSKASTLLEMIEAARTPDPKTKPFEGSFRGPQAMALERLIEVISMTDAIQYLDVRDIDDGPAVLVEIPSRKGHWEIPLATYNSASRRYAFNFSPETEKDIKMFARWAVDQDDVVWVSDEPAIALLNPHRNGRWSIPMSEFLAAQEEFEWLSFAVLTDEQISKFEEWAATRPYITWISYEEE